MLCLMFCMIFELWMEVLRHVMMHQMHALCDCWGFLDVHGGMQMDFGLIVYKAMHMCDDD